MNKSDFVYDAGLQDYSAVIGGIETEIDAAYFGEGTIRLAEKIVSALPAQAEAIAHFCMTNENFCCAWPKMTLEQVLSGLGIPLLRVYDDGGALSYCEQKFDDEHIIEIVFSGVLQTMLSLSIDG